MEKSEQNQTVLLRLDDLSLERATAGYPEELRQQVMWLGCFVREECMRDLDILVNRCQSLKIVHDKTSWSRILRGRWNQDASSNPLPNPIIALGKVLSAIKTLRDDQRVREMSGKVPFVETPTTLDIFRYIDARRAPERVNRFGVIVGYTGSQKTVTLKAYAAKHNHGLCVWMESPENGSMKEFVTWLSVKYGGSRHDSYEGCRRRVFDTVNERSTILIDNAQALYKPRMGTDQPVFGFLRRLQDEKQCTIILSITPEFNKQLQEQMMQGYFEQFEGRAGGRKNFLVLPDHPPEEDVLCIARAFKLKDADKQADYLVKLARLPGRIRILFEALQGAKVLAESEEKPLTIQHIKAVRDED